MWLIFCVFAFSAVSEPELAKVIVDVVKKSDDIRKVILPVRVEPRLKANVVAEAEGWVTKIRKPLGSRVRAGDLVLVLENKDPAFTFAQVGVRSPVAGVISQLEPSLMTKVSRGDRLFSVTNPEQVKLTAEAPASGLEILRPDLKGEFRSDSMSEPLALRVAAVSPVVDPRTGSAPVELVFEDNQKVPVLGSVGQASFEVSKGKLFLVPESAISYFEGKPQIRIVSAAGKVTKKQVTLGQQKESLLEIKDGLFEGEKLILRASRQVKEGETVSIEVSAKQ